MPAWLPILIMIFSLILVLDAIGSFVAWRYLHNRLFLLAGFAWLANFINFIIHGMTQSTLGYFSLFGHGVYFFTSCLLTTILCEISNLKFDFKKVPFIAILMWCLSFISFYLFKSYMISALVLDLFIAAPMFYFSFKVLLKEEDRLTKFYAIILIVNSIHFLDYPFLYDSPKGSIFGFSLAFLIAILYSILIPLLIVQEQSKKSVIMLEGLVKDRTRNLEERTLELEELNKHNVTLISMVCHELASPAMMIEHQLKQMKKKEQELTLDCQKYLHSMQKQMNALIELFVKIKSVHSTRLGKIEPQLIKTNIVPVVSEVIDLYQERLENKNLKIEFASAESHLDAQIDPVLFKNQVLANLISNAIKFSYEGSVIRINLEKKDQAVVMDVVDYGIGISEEKIHKLFDMNVKTTTVGTKNESGTGLGLPTVKIITERMGGTVKVVSRLRTPDHSPFDAGTVFSISLNS